MKNNKIEAVVLLAKCCKTKETYGMRVEKKKDGKWHFTWSFKIDENVAKNEGYNETKIYGDMVFDETYRGCPYCGATGWTHCETCGMLTCNDGKHEKLVCTWCGNEGIIEPLPQEFELKGGEM